MSILKEAENYVQQVFKDKLSASHHYHNWSHTKCALDHALEIMNGSQVTDLEKEQIQLALYFHDIGYTDGESFGHEKRSSDLVEEFLKEHNQTVEYISKVKDLILVTEMGSKPNNFPEEIIKDADCSHISMANYTQISEALRKEWAETAGKSFSDKEWYEENLNFLKFQHSFYTDYAQQNWQKQKDINIAKIEEQLSVLKENNSEKPTKKKKKSKKKKSEKEVKTDRSFDTMFRVTINNHTRLSDIADSKANILLSVNAIIISICLSTLIPKLDSPSNEHLVWPTFIMLGFNVVSIIFAILSTRPKITKQNFTLLDVQNRKVNILFFGNFNRLDLDQFISAMWELYEDKKYLYETLVKDLYYLGKVLDRKYKLLKYTYTIFMIGIVVSVLAFVVAFLQL